MSEASSPRIAVLLDQLESDYHFEIIAGVRKIAARAGARVVVIAGGSLAKESEQDARNFIYSSLPGAALDGVIVLSGCLSNYAGVGCLPAFVRPLRGRPLVTIGVPVPEVASILVDNGFAVRKVVAHLLETHRATNIAFLRGPKGSLESESRLAGYLAAIEAWDPLESTCRHASLSIL